MTPPRAVPLYQRVKDYLRSHIESGAWPVDYRVPSEHELVRTLGASRMTVNRAVRELAAEGRIRRVQGVGSFVADARPQSALLEIRNIAEEIRERGHSHGCAVHLLRQEPASDAVATAMDLTAGTLVFHSILVHGETGVPVQLEDRYVNPAVAPDYLDMDFQAMTPNEYLMRAAPLGEVEHIVEAVLPDTRTQALLDIPATEPCLLLHRRTWSGGHVASRAWLTHPGGRYCLGARFATAAASETEQHLSAPTDPLPIRIAKP